MKMQISNSNLLAMEMANFGLANHAASFTGSPMHRIEEINLSKTRVRDCFREHTHIAVSGKVLIGTMKGTFEGEMQIFAHPSGLKWMPRRIVLFTSFPDPNIAGVFDQRCTFDSDDPIRRKIIREGRYDIVVKNDPGGGAYETKGYLAVILASGHMSQMGSTPDEAVDALITFLAARGYSERREDYDIYDETTK